MEKLPHRYAVSATANTEGTVELASPGLVPIDSAPPIPYDGPGDCWSPETLLVASVADCFILTFRAIARASKLDWISVSCDVEGILDRANGITQFTEFQLGVILEAPVGTDENKALRLLEKAERDCLITNSLSSKIHLDTKMQIAI
jgi:organic hydroperoxide reductase OsmC/OhrA